MSRKAQMSDNSSHVHIAVAHDSAAKHVAGRARYVDDMPEPPGLQHAYVGTSACAHARIIAMDLSAVMQYPGVTTVITASDISGSNDISPAHTHDEPVLASDLVQFAGQPLFAVAARTRKIARQAARLAKVEYEELPATLDIRQALASQSYVLEPSRIQRGDPSAVLASSPLRLQGEILTGGQDHFYLEGQVSMAIPEEDGDLSVLTSSQHPSEVQQLIAANLGKANNTITVKVRRMGGAFGGKETQAGQWAIIAALIADQTGQPVKIRLDRDDDMRSTGKRHDFLIRYDVGFTEKGQILAIDFIQAARCGISADLSGPIADRAMFHSDNAYYLPNCDVSQRQRLLPAQCQHHILPLQDQYRVQYGFPRLWWSPGYDGYRARHGCHCLRAWQRPAGYSASQLLWHRRTQYNAL
jgi:xanthine dehydrogenase large subunit